MRLRLPPLTKLIQRIPQADPRVVVEILLGTADIEGKVFSHYRHAKTKQGRLWTPRQQLAKRLVERCGAIGQAIRAMSSDRRHAELAKTLGVTSELARISNAAADASINDDLRDAGCEMFADDGGFVLPSTIGAPDFQTYPFYFRHLMSRRRTPETSTSICSGMVRIVLGLPLILITGTIGLPMTLPCPVGKVCTT